MHFTAAFQLAELGALNCSVTLPPGGQTLASSVPASLLREGLAKLEGPVFHSPQTPLNKQALFEHLHISPYSWEGASSAAGRSSNRDLLQQEAWGSVSQSWQREQQEEGRAD